MADLLPFARQTPTGITAGISPVVTSEAPQSHLSGSDVAQPYQELASALDKTGGALDKLAEPLAEKAGATAITRDADGNIQIDRQPFVGPAGEVYARAVKMGALADGEGQAKRDDIALRQQYRDNPEGYQAAATAYKQRMVDQYGQAGGPVLGAAVGRAIDGVTTQTYRGLLNEKERLDLQRADQSISAGVSSARDDAMALARQGVDPNAPEMQAILGKYTTLQNERMANPRLAYTKDQADLDYQQFQSNLAAQRYLYHIDQTYKDGGYRAAIDDAKDILSNESYKLSPQDRESYYHKAVGEVRANEAIRRQDIGEARAAFNELTMASATGAHIDPDQVEQVAQAFRAANDPGSAARVYASFSRKSLNDEFGRQPLSQQIQQVDELKGMPRQAAAYEFFRSKGYSAAAASGIVGGLRGETANLDTTQIHDGGIGLGIAGWNQERLSALKSYAASQGKPVTDLQTQLEFVDHELQTTEKSAGDRIRAAQTPEEAGQATLGYFRPKDFDVPGAHPERAQYARAAFNVFGGGAAPGTREMPPGLTGSPASTAWLAANRQLTLDKELWTSWQTVMKDYGDKGIRPNDQAVTSIIDGARATGNSALLEQVSHDMARIGLAQDVSREPLGVQQQALTQLAAAGQAGSLSPGQAAVYKDLQTRNAAITKGLQDNPIQTAVANFPDKFKTPPPLNLQDPQQLVAGLKMRGQIAQVAAQNWQSGPLSALDKQDVADMKAALANPDPAVKAGIYGAIATLPEDVRGATLKKLAGNEPAAMTEAAAGSMMATAPDVAASIFRGQAAMKTDKAYVPTTGSEEAAFKDKIGALLPASTFSLAARTDEAGPFAVAQNMVKARYADLSAQAGDTSGKFNQDRLTQAVTDVTGGILDHNGGKLFAPVRGMPQGDFDRVIAGVGDNDMAGVSTLSGQPVTADYLKSAAKLESIGNGRYYVRLNSDMSAAPVYAYQGANTEAPQKFVLDLRNRQPAPADYSMAHLTQGIAP